MQRLPDESMEAYKIRRAYVKEQDKRKLKGILVDPASPLNRKKKRVLEFKADQTVMLHNNFAELIRFADSLKINTLEYIDAKRDYNRYKNCTSREWLDAHLAKMVSIIKENLPYTKELAL
jgi:hypothetical protein